MVAPISTPAAEPTLRVLLYRFEPASQDLYPCGPSNSISEFTPETGALIRKVFSWEFEDDLASVLEDDQYSYFRAMIIERFSPTHHDESRTPAALMAQVKLFKNKVNIDTWAAIASGHHFPIAVAFCLQLELIAGIFSGYSDIYVVIQ